MTNPIKKYRERRRRIAARNDAIKALQLGRQGAIVAAVGVTLENRHMASKGLGMMDDATLAVLRYADADTDIAPIAAALDELTKKSHQEVANVFDKDKKAEKP